MKRINKKTKQIVVLFALFISFFAFAEENEAAKADVVLTAWKNKSKTFVINENYDHNYMTLNFINGYTYKQTSKDISTLTDKLNGYYRTQYYRTYSKY